MAGSIEGAAAPGGVVLIDGDCSFCGRMRFFVERRSVRGTFAFFASGSPEGQAWLERAGLPSSHRGSVVLVYGHRAWTASGAALRIARRMRFPWPLVSALLLVPRPLRDWAYRLVADRRHAL